MSIFAAKTNGMESMLMSMIPDDVKQSIAQLKNDLPEMIEFAKKRLESIDNNINQILEQQNDMRTRCESVESRMDLLRWEQEQHRLKTDPDATPREI